MRMAITIKSLSNRLIENALKARNIPAQEESLGLQIR